MGKRLKNKKKLQLLSINKNPTKYNKQMENYWKFCLKKGKEYEF
jgi:hypothetical protein